MRVLDCAIAIYLNELHRTSLYIPEKYQMLQGVRYQKELPKEYRELLRKKYRNNCYGVALEMKSYYAKNGFLSNTIVLKLRPETPEQKEIKFINIFDSVEGVIKKYTHHAIEIFKENGKYKVNDVLHRDEVLWLEEYLDEVCKANCCERERLCYDMGYLAPCHAFATNMQELSDLMRYLDKKYCIGKPRMNLFHVPKEEDEGMFLSDTIVMDFNEFGKPVGASKEEVMRRWPIVYDRMMAFRFNTLHALCLAQIMRDPFMIDQMAGKLFDDETLLEFMEML